MLSEGEKTPSSCSEENELAVVEPIAKGALGVSVIHGSLKAWKTQHQHDQPGLAAERCQNLMEN